ncbi:ANTAR domain-containing protein [Nocardia sp. NPDC050697]|uniref:ANTAR domain-containing protein n=1 Tax=Nocardia sp. NPDC050697 TaxID=3155158 RepID=UPI0033C780F7
MSDDHPETRPDPLAELLPELADAAAPVEQAQVALMLVYGISATEAIEVLHARARRDDLDTLDLATALVAALPGLGGSATLRERLDRLLGPGPPG